MISTQEIKDTICDKLDDIKLKIELVKDDGIMLIHLKHMKKEYLVMLSAINKVLALEEIKN